MNRRSAIETIFSALFFSMAGCRALTINHWQVRHELGKVDCVQLDRGDVVISDEETIEELRQVYHNSRWMFIPGKIPSGTVAMRYMADQKEFVTIYVQGNLIYLNNTWVAYVDGQTMMRLLAITGIQSDFIQQLKTLNGF